MSRGRVVALWLILFGVWLMLSGHYDRLFLSFGVVTCTLAVFVAVRMGTLDAESVPLQMTFRAITYLPWLIWQILKSNWDVGRIILSPRLPIDPEIVHFRASQRTDLGRFIYANSITLTPGTVTTGIVGDDFEVHALSQEQVDGSEENEMNLRVLKLEGRS